LLLKEFHNMRWHHQSKTFLIHPDDGKSQHQLIFVRLLVVDINLEGEFLVYRTYQLVLTYYSSTEEEDMAGKAMDEDLATVAAGSMEVDIKEEEVTQVVVVDTMITVAEVVMVLHKVTAVEVMAVGVEAIAMADLVVEVAMVVVEAIVEAAEEAVTPSVLVSTP
jgi:hypothetical protein